MNLSAEIITAFQQGEMAAFEHLYRAYAGRVYNYILSMVKEPAAAEDLTQGLFVRLWEKRGNVDIDGNLTGYIYTVARNMVYHHVKKRLFEDSCYLKLFGRDDGGRDGSIEDELDYRFVENRIVELSGDLPPGRREIFLMRWQQGLSNTEIARRLAISEKTVSTQIHRSMVYLRERLKADFPLFAIVFAAVFLR